MADRYFIDEPITADRVVLSGAEAHHLIHVMRAAAGQQATLFDGSGDEFLAVVERVRRAEVELAIRSREHVNRELPFELILGVALPKGDRQKWLVEKAVELGVTRIVALQTSRTVAEPGDQAIARLRRAVIEASKQCGRNRLMAIDAAQSWPNFLAATAAEPCCLLAHPDGGQSIGATASAGVAVALPPQHLHRVFAAIGPEGGFTDDEVANAIANGWRPVNFGPRILRIETAALFIAAVVIERWTA
ncbi:MAG: 16S rRNA (uracil(1498)-N(3))-methyltransferase [Planctomycetaceae bacterium]|nr:16S rRNA (uracil(1498)-N(3))-methyltransferase [Planctomycetaceae bacterium]